MTWSVTLKWLKQTLTSFQHCGLCPFVPQTNRLSWNISTTVITFSQGPYNTEVVNAKSLSWIDSVFHLKNPLFSKLAEQSYVITSVILFLLRTSRHCRCPVVFRGNSYRKNGSVKKCNTFFGRDLINRKCTFKQSLPPYWQPRMLHLLPKNLVFA